MRNHLMALIVAMAEREPDVLFLTGDLGFSVVEAAQEAMGERFINAGVAEANMMTMAGALGLSGFEPYVYSITPFVTARCYEQIRNDVCYHGVKARIVGTGAGYSYGTLGPTHHALEDAHILAALPSMTVFSPATLSELNQLFALSDQIPGPIYYRIARENGPTAPAVSFTLDEPICVWRGGVAVNLVTSGCLAEQTFLAADILAEQGIEARLITVPVIAPFPAEALAKRMVKAPTLVAFEGYEGNPLEVGVLGMLADGLICGPVARRSAGRAFASTVGGTEHQRRAVGLDAEALAKAALALLR